MESYVQFDQRSDIEFYSRHPEREDLPQLLQHQAQLPSFRDIIPPHLQPLAEVQPPQTSQINQGFEAQSDILTSSVQDHPATSRPLATSPTYSQGSSMPSLTGEFEDMNVRSSETMFSTPSQSMGTMDRSASWMPATQYQSMPTAYAQNTQRVSQIGSQQVSSRASPNLPPIRDINQQRTASYDQTYGASNGQMTQVSQLGSYPQMYATSQPTTSDLDTAAFARGMSYHDGQYARFAPSYPQASRTYQSADYTRYNATPYEPYRYNSGYRASFGDMNYTPHAMVGSQPAAYGIQGDLSGAHNRRRRGNLPKPVTDILRTWFHEHLDHPYPSEEDKQIFIQKTGLTISQISNWFINARRRHWPALRQNREQARNSTLRRSDSGGASI